MKALKFDLEVPFWCSFGDFSSLNIKLSYPCPPLPTLFGLIQNALGKEVLHNINDNQLRNKLMKEYIDDFNSLKFAIIVNDCGELIEDYVNIHKGSREKEKHENDFKKYLEDLIQDNPHNSEIKTILNKIKKYSFYIFLKNGTENDEYEELLILLNQYDEELPKIIISHWDKIDKTIENYQINKIWLSTQINRQRLINPSFTIYIISDDNGEFSLENIKNALINPKRSLYLGESDDLVNILNISIVEIENNNSSSIVSIVPGLYQNSNLIKLPTKLKFDKNQEFFTLCSIPKGELNEVIECYEYNGENIVFL